MSTNENTQQTSFTSQSLVLTARPDRYLKQLASHLGQRLQVSYEEGNAVWTFDNGRCDGKSVETGIEFVAESTTEAGLERIENVIGRHLERFGERDELSVVWTRA